MGREAFAPAKINLFLHVGRRAGGYHPLCSLMVFADVGDRVCTHAGGGLQVHGPFGADLAGEDDNLVSRAARAIMSRARGPEPVLGLALDKQLPVASGLGGGSSDAGATLRLLRAELGLDIPDADLEAVATELGSDGAACLWGRPVVAQGRGERLSPAPLLPALDAVLVNPRVPVSTAEVYRRFDEAGCFEDVAPPAMPSAFEDVAELAGWLSGQRNDLEAAAIAVAPPVGAVLDLLAGEPEALLSRVSGSGGSCFALCSGDLEAEALAARVAAMAPGWWVRCCRLGGPWPDSV